MIAKVLCLVCCVNVLSAQTAVYRAPGDTAFLITSNPHRLYWVRGGDTVGAMNESLTLTAQRWRPADGGFVVTTRQLDLDIQRSIRDDTLNVDASGHVAVPPGRAGDHAVDFTVHFPRGAPRLATGFTWADTTQSSHVGGSGPLPTRDFRVARRLTVTRQFDTLGTRVVEITCDGDVHYADAWWEDSAAGSYAWTDVSGPTHEVYWFDAAAGRLVGRRWAMKLHGNGGTPAEHGTDTVPAGLTASESEHTISASIARVLYRPLPGRDTTFTFATHNGKVTGIDFTQTEQFDTAGIEAGFARADGMMGTMRATFAHGRPRTYDATWTDSAGRPVYHHLSVQGDRIVLHEDLALDTLPRPAVDTTLTPPSRPWAVAEYAQEELLVPVARTLAPDTLPHAVMIFRPTPRHWDTVRLRVQALAGTPSGPLVVTEFASPEANPTVMIIASDGTLLYLEDRREQGWRRLPSMRSRRYAELEAIIKSLK
jgi:hypothetical protein